MQIIFVCTGNTCRSPLAESIAKSQLKDHEIESRGVYAIDGQPIASESRTLIENHDLPMVDAAQNFSAKDLSADLILTMTQTHKMVLQTQYPEVANVYTLKEYIDEQGDIADPIGGGPETYQAVYQELDELIHILAQKLS
ncbi:low molecular weight protein arginine phosphatase [Staphylococcus auricularis]|uniref:low molecular weight protein arginine phosphatase n=1 Tax=Staphylococcus auricularis TaxID=29379 RepID=UPI002432E353|nr:low molecular weight protein arginine phosphatase [Staphylococcus auricularis]